MRLCDGCGKEKPQDEFDRCGCGVELCGPCHEQHAESCFEEEE